MMSELHDIIKQRRTPNSEQERLIQNKLSDLLPGSPGGRALRDQYGAPHFATIGQRGGYTTVQRHGREHMRMLGRRSAEARHWKKFKGPYTRKQRFSLHVEVERVIPWWPHQPERSRNRKYPVLVAFLIDIQPNEVS